MILLQGNPLAPIYLTSLGAWLLGAAGHACRRYIGRTKRLIRAIY